MPFLSRSSFWAAIATSLLALLGFFWLIPYATTYNDSTPLPLGRMIWLLWMTSPDWQHCLMVPFISAGLVWSQRDQLRMVPIQGSIHGLYGLLVGLFFYWFGFRAEVQYIGYLSAQWMVGSLIVWFFGWSMLRALFFPWAFLIFMWPFVFLEGTLAFPLRLFMSKFTYVFLNLIGLDCMMSGTAILSSPNFTLGVPAGQKFAVDIANPCSGIRSLFALMMLSALYAHLVLRQTWQRWVLFGSAIPLAIFGNFLRMLMLTFGTMLFGSEFAIGPIGQPSWFHLSAGFVVFAAALGGMVGVGWMLEQNWAQWWIKIKQIKNPALRSTPHRHSVPGDSY